MKNYSLLKSMMLSAIALIMFGCNQQTEQETPPKPNIIYIMADDLGYGDLGCYGQEHIQTPNIDQLASGGILFTDHYAGSAVCAPSRSVLITGQHTGHTPIRGNMQWEPHGQMPLPDESVTVAELMKQAGYKTGMIGKWGLGLVQTEGNPLDQGWDFFYGYTDQVLAHNYYPEYLVRNEEREYLNNEVKYLDTTAWHDGYGSYSTKKVEYSNDLFTKEALKFLDKNQNDPFFLYLPYTIPHNNGEAPEGQMQEVPDYGMYDKKNWSSDRKGYAAMITRLDAYVGEIVEKVKENNLAANTLIIFTSDNGPMQEDKHEFTAFFNSNGRLKGGKRDLYEGGIRIPLIAWWPGIIEAGRKTDHISCFQDFMPTACDLAGIEIPEFTDGISYKNVLTGADQQKHNHLYWEFHEGDKSQALRMGKWKAIRLNVYENPDAPVRLYNLVKDIQEQNNVAEDYPDIVDEMRNLMETSREPDPNWNLYKTEGSR
jgi:arylsulfatase A-like enzyme